MDSSFIVNLLKFYTWIIMLCVGKFTRFFWSFVEIFDFLEEFPYKNF